MRLLIIDPEFNPLPSGVSAFCDRQGWSVVRATDYASAMDALSRSPMDAAILSPPVDSLRERERDDFPELIRRLDAERVATLLFGGEGGVATGALVESIGRDISLAELGGRLAMIDRYQRVLRILERELDSMRTLGSRLDQHFREIDQEMNLAGRLQRDFLPRCPVQIGRCRFEAIYRPASWVSGDMFDILRINEHHTGVYVADAVGHGVAAGLLTMFIKRAVAPEVTHGEGSRVATPCEVLTALNNALTDQNLPHCQFVTACYSVVDHRTLTLSIAGGGHPYPILVSGDGTTAEVKAVGGLLGLSRGEEFLPLDVPLRSGDKLLYYTDGLETAIMDGDMDSTVPNAHVPVLADILRAPLPEAIDEIERRMNSGSGSLRPVDDVTVVGMEVLP